MDYEMMVKCAYEEIVDGIEKEALDYSQYRSVDSLPPEAAHAVRSIAQDPGRYEKVMNRIANRGIRRKLDAAQESMRRYSNALDNMSSRGVSALSPNYMNAASKYQQLSGTVDKLNRQNASLRSFRNMIDNAR